MKIRNRVKREILIHLRNTELTRKLVRRILTNAEQNKCGFKDLRTMHLYANRMGLSLFCPEAVESSFKGYLTAIYDVLSKQERKDLSIPKATRGCYWLQGYYSALRIIKEIIKTFPA